MQEPKDRLIAAKEVAEILGVSIVTVNNYRLRGKFKVKVFGPRCVRYFLSSVMAIKAEIHEIRTGEICT